VPSLRVAGTPPGSLAGPAPRQRRVVDGLSGVAADGSDRRPAKFSQRPSYVYITCDLAYTRKYILFSFGVVSARVLIQDECMANVTASRCKSNLHDARLPGRLGVRPIFPHPSAATPFLIGSPRVEAPFEAHQQLMVRDTELTELPRCWPPVVQAACCVGDGGSAVGRLLQHK
jgi:hypothetical protein